MTGRRALVKRPDRKMHLAHMAPNQRTWITFCDLLVKADDQTVVHDFDSIGGATARLVKQLRGIVSHVGREHLCANCRTYIALIDLLQYDRAHGPAFEYRLTA